MKVGLIQVITALDMGVISFVCESYELAIAQAHELMKDTDYPIEELPETIQENGMRQRVWKTPAVYELLVVQEIEVGTQVLPNKKNAK